MIKSVQHLFAGFLAKLGKGKNGNLESSFIDSAGASSPPGQNYHKNEIALQRLYEKWVTRETWRLRDQAIPLLFGLDPDSVHLTLTETELEPRFSNLWEHARQCVDQALLPVVNRQCNAAAWEAKPVDIYQWATVSRLSVPEPLIALMEFLVKVLPQTIETDSVNQDKVRILGAALAVLSAYPEQCKDAGGQVRPEKIIALIQAKQAILYGNQLPALPITAQIGLLSDCLGKVAGPD